MGSSTRDIVRFAARVVLGVALLALVLRGIDGGELLDSLRGLSWMPLLIAVAAQAAQRLLWALRWRAILAAHGIYRRLGDLVALVLIGLFFNSFFPTSVGGDVVRGYYAARGRERMLTSYLVVAIERLLGVVSFALFAAVPSTLALLLGDSRFPRELLWSGALIGWSVVLAGAVVFGWRGWSSAAARLPLVGRVIPKLSRGLELFRRPENPRLLVIGSSLGVKVLAMIFYIGCARAVGVETPAMLFFLIVPATLGGAVALLTLTVSTAFSLVGGLIYPFYRASHQPEAPAWQAAPADYVVRQERRS